MGGGGGGGSQNQSLEEMCGVVLEFPYMGGNTYKNCLPLGEYCVWIFYTIPLITCWVFSMWHVTLGIPHIALNTF